MDGLPGAEAWVAAYADVPDDERHLAIHDQHLVAVNDRDRPLITPEVLHGHGRGVHARRSSATGWPRWPRRA